MSNYFICGVWDTSSFTSLFLSLEVKNPIALKLLGSVDTLMKLKIK